MDNRDDDDRVIMILAEPANGDGFVFCTADPYRAIEQLNEWAAKFGADRVRGNEGFEELARPLMNAQDSQPLN